MNTATLFFMVQLLFLFSATILKLLGAEFNYAELSVLGLATMISGLYAIGAKQDE